MFVFNVKVNGSKIFKCFFVGIIILLIMILGIVMYRVFSGADDSSNSNSCSPKSESSTISPRNYTNVLKTVHENIDPYVGKKISFTGYVYRVSDLQENQFVLARDMLINSNSQTVVVGFLSEYDEAKNFEDGTWVTVCGEIIKGNYHGDMPILKVTEITVVDKPSQEEYVYPPDESYIPTSTISYQTNSSLLLHQLM